MDDERKDRMAYDGPSATAAGDELVRITNLMGAVNNLLLDVAGVCGHLGQREVDYLIDAEEKIADVLSDSWDDYQNVLAAAPERALEEVDTSAMGRPLPKHFKDATPESVKVELAKRRAKLLRRVPTNTATHEDKGIPL